LTQEHVCNEPGDIEAWLELALISIDFDLNCADVIAYNKALYVLSRALEANPTVATLWIFYIGLYYHDKSEIGDDDLFFHAIENSKGSYELLLLYINSRTTIQERMKAYDLALGALINAGEHSQDQSARILDVVLKMVDFICVAKLTQYLHIWVENVVNTSSTSVLTCLTPEDCCILMVACAYAVAFAQLPRNCILRLGCRQQLPWNIDWSKLSEVQEGSKDLVLKMMEAGLQCDSILSQEVSERVMAINYLKCLALYYGSEHALLTSRQIMERHPTFIEVILFIVHLEGEKGWKNVFQKALQSFTERSSDQQRLWYQYAVHMLSAEGRVGAMTVLHQCAAAACQGSNGWDFIGSDGMAGTGEGLQLYTRKFLKPDDSCMIGREAVFSWMNLALYELLVGNEVDAQISLEKSMKAADIWEDVFHCWKELAVFIRFRKAGQEQATAIFDLLDRLVNNSG
jgi:tetratricopeptide (TPR) repeat protein